MRWPPFKGLLAFTWGQFHRKCSVYLFLISVYDLNQCWARFVPPYGVTRPQWVEAGETHFKCLLFISSLSVRWPPFINLKHPADLGLNHTHHFHIPSSDEVVLGAWWVADGWEPQPCFIEEDNFAKKSLAQLTLLLAPGYQAVACVEPWCSECGCHNNAVNFLQNSYKIHPTARLLGRDMGFILWVQTLIYTLS